MIEPKVSSKMICSNCQIECQRFGKHRNGLRRFRCAECQKTYTQAHEKPLGSMTVPREKALLALKLLIEGSSIRSVERVTDLHRDTICRLIVLAGKKCEKLLGRLIVNIPARDVECDEVWQFVAKKEKMVTLEDDPNLGDSYTFVAVLNFALGKRDQKTTNVFIEGLRHAIAPQRFQITTDGFAPYKTAIPDTLGDRCDYAMLIKVYRATPEGERKYSPAEVVDTEVVPVWGNPDERRICTSIVERQNLTMRMQMRRLTRLTNGFSKKWENLCAALCLHFAYYNFCRIHSSLRVTPAMQAGIADHVWTIAELLA